jgi:nitrile hydratase accessory protein
MDRTVAVRVARDIPGVPQDADGPVFREPWQAQAFAMTLALYDRGLFTWPEWAATLAAEIKRAQAAGDPDTGETYYSHWLAARFAKAKPGAGMIVLRGLETAAAVVIVLFGAALLTGYLVSERLFI